MKSLSHPFAAALALSFGMSPLIASPSPISGIIDVVENDTLNNPSSVTLSFEHPPSAGVSLVPTLSNRGDYTIDVLAHASDADAGVLVSSVSQLGRDPGGGTVRATSSIAESSDGVFYIPVHSAPAGSEYNMNVSFAFLPFEDWLGALVINPTSPTLRSGTTGLLDSDFSNPGTGRTAVDLRDLGARSEDGILLANSFTNSDSYALVSALANGTFEIQNRDNGTQGALQENAAVGFAYISKHDVGTRGVAAMARVNNDATTDVEAGTFTLTKMTTGTWRLTIDGHTPTTGTLVVTPAAGATNNGDNIVVHERIGSGWQIESRDIPASGGSSINPQNGATPGEDMFNFAFFEHAVAPAVPTLTTNLALGGRARQSSTSPMPHPARADATLAIDGGASALQSATDPTATGPQWWEVELPRDADVTEVEVLNGTAGDRSRLRDVRIELRDAAGSVLATSSLLNPANAGFTFPAGPERLSATFAPTGAPVRFVRVTRTPDGAANILSLREVLVAGSYIDTEPSPAPVASYDSRKAAPDPTSQGWHANDILLGSNAKLVPTANEAAWQIDSHLEGGLYDDSSYEASLNPADLRAAYELGWSLSAEVKPGSGNGDIRLLIDAADNPGWGSGDIVAILQFASTDPGDPTPNAFSATVVGSGNLVTLAAGSADTFHTVTLTGFPGSNDCEWAIDGVTRGTINLATNTLPFSNQPHVGFVAQDGAVDFKRATFQTGTSTALDTRNGIRLYLPFEGGQSGNLTFVDRAIFPRAPLAINGTPPAAVNGISGAGIDFPDAGGTSLASTEIANRLGALDSATVSFWLADDATEVFSFSNSNDPTSFTRFHFPSGDLVRVETENSGGAAGTALEATATGRRDGAWHHFAIAYSPAGSTLYYDGEQIATGTAGFTGAVNDIDTFAIGGGVTGRLDEFAVWNRALSSDEIAAVQALGYGGSSLALDQDGDSLNRFEEASLGTSDTVVDSDGDGIPDGEELVLLTDPADDDSDDDSLSDGAEIAAGTDPREADTDGDGSPDQLDSDPLDVSVFPTTIDLTDTDGDGLTAPAEALLGTSDILADSDGDGTDDDVELLLGTDPATASSKPAATDADGDGLLAAQDPDDTELDTDGDGHPDHLEVNLGSDPDDPTSEPATATLSSTSFVLLENDDVEVGFTAAGDLANLRIQSSSDLMLFTDLTPVTIEPDGDYTITVTPPAGHRFFRATAESNGVPVFTSSAQLTGVPASGVVEISEGQTFAQTVNFTSPYTGYVSYSVVGMRADGRPLPPQYGTIPVNRAGSAVIQLTSLDDLSTQAPGRYTITLTPHEGLSLGIDTSITVVVLDDDELWSGTIGIAGEQMNFLLESAKTADSIAQRLTASDPSGLCPQGTFPITADFGATEFIAQTGVIPLLRELPNLSGQPAVITGMSFTGSKPSLPSGGTLEGSIEGTVTITLKPPGGGAVEKTGTFSLSKQPPLMPSGDLSLEPSS